MKATYSQEAGILSDPRRGWRRVATSQATAFFVGRPPATTDVLASLRGGSQTAQESTVRTLLRSQVGHYGLIVENEDLLFAAVDRIRSYPIFFTSEPMPAVAIDARALADAKRLDEWDHDGLLDFVMCGYTSGQRTTRQGLRQLQAGEYLLFDKRAHTFSIHRYYRYLPRPRLDLSDDAWVDRFGCVVDQVFRRTIEIANGRPIWVPLSGGYDSRLIAAKLHELGYDNITCFTYGPRLNHDARVARHVVEKLGLPWHRIQSSRGEVRHLYEHPTRQSYWRFADHLSTIPTMREYQALTTLRAQIPDNALIINGQSGDFLSGGHIPAKLQELDGKSVGNDELDRFYSAVVSKHWSLWAQLTKGNSLKHARDVLRSQTAIMEARDRDELIAEYEAWEYEERQCKFVISGQRIYEFFELDWQLPHWDGAFLDFWEEVPFHLKFGQTLYKRLLKRWDYKGLFNRYDPIVWRWPLHMMWVLPVAQLAQLTAGRTAKDRTYKLLWYFSHYHNQYVQFGLPHYLKTRHEARSPISLLVETWLHENDIADDMSQADQIFQASQCR